VCACFPGTYLYLYTFAYTTPHSAQHDRRSGVRGCGHSGDLGAHQRVRGRVRQGRPDAGAHDVGQDPRGESLGGGHQQDGRQERDVVQGKIRQHPAEAPTLPEAGGLRTQGYAFPFLFLLSSELLCLVSYI
jgi:hypothetical protein